MEGISRQYSDQDQKSIQASLTTGSEAEVGCDDSYGDDAAGDSATEYGSTTGGALGEPAQIETSTIGAEGDASGFDDIADALKLFNDRYGVPLTLELISFTREDTPEAVELSAEPIPDVEQPSDI